MPSRAAVKRSNKRRREEGYVLVLAAMLIVPLMTFVGFATDVGAWYVEGQKIQRASDAAALAAVVWMPDEDAAVKAALEVAALNGYPDQTLTGVPNDPDNPTSLDDFDNPNAPLPQVKVTPLGRQSLRVEIRAEGDLYFAGIADIDSVEIDRAAAAEYILPVPMGNPTSSLGSADLNLGGSQNYWLNAHANCFTAGAGDLLNSGRTNTAPHSCHTNPDNPFYQDRGYTYVVTKPAGVSVDVQVLHGGSCKRPGWDNSRGEDHSANQPALEFDLYVADNTPLIDSDNVSPVNLFGSFTINENDGTKNASSGTYCPDFDASGNWIDEKWVTVFTIPAAAPEGRWFLTVGTPRDSTGHKNMYGLRVLGSNFPVGQEWCSTLDPTTVMSGTCPTINALDHLSIYIGENRPSPTIAPEAANFYFAEIGEFHAGKTLEITLWDPAEGSRYLQFLDAKGIPQPFRYRHTNIHSGNNSGWQSIAGCTEEPPVGPCLPTTGGNPFHNRLLTIEIELPSNYACDGDDCWWQVRYASTQAVDDTTTWAVRIIGDPVHLIE